MDAGGEQWQLELGNSNSSKDDIVIMHIIALHCLLFMFTHYLSNKPSCMYLVSCINLCLKISRQGNVLIEIKGLSRCYIPKFCQFNSIIHSG